MVVKRLVLCPALAALLLWLAVASSAAVIRVRSDSPFGGPGNDWDHAYHTVSAGLNAAASGDEVWVAKGHYVERITLKVGVALYGGFGGAETARDQRNWKTNETTLDGAQGGTVVTSPEGATNATRIDGFTITNGLAERAGGVYCYKSSPTIANNAIVSNSVPGSTRSGAAVYCENSAAVIAANVLSGNRPLRSNNSEYPSAGVMGVESSLTAVDNLITRNGPTVMSSAYAGAGGIYCSGGSATVRGNTILANRGTGIIMNSGGTINYTVADNVVCGNFGGAAISCATGSTTSTIEGNIIAGNKCLMSALGVDNCAGLVANNLIADNTGVYGAYGMWCSYGSPTVVNNTIVRNVGLKASTNGYGIYVFLLSASLSNNIVAFNSGGIRAASCTPTLSHNNVYSNNSKDYSGVSPGAGDISVDPGFLAPWVREYHLRPNSPCVDAGDETAIQVGWSDLDGKARILGAKPDIGCFEWDATPYWIRNAWQARAIADGFPIELRSRTVSAPLAGAFYLEDTDRLGGLRVISSQPVSLGDLATASGMLVLDNGERALQASVASAVSGDPENVPAPLWLTNRSLGGGDYFWGYNGESCGQQGVTGGCGLSNIGLLVTTCGTVTHVGGSLFYIDDGSGASDGGDHPGVKVYGAGAIGSGDGLLGRHVTVTGISGSEWNGSCLARVIRARSPKDVCVDR